MPNRRKRFGKHDQISFSVEKANQTEQALDVVSALTRLGGVYDIFGRTLDTSSERVESVEPIRKERGPVPMTSELIERVQEPDHASKLVEVAYEHLNILKEPEEWPAPEPRWDGVWHGSEESRVFYLKQHIGLWALLRESEVQRFTSCFFILKKNGFNFKF